MTVLIQYINLLNHSWITKCLFLRNMELLNIALCIANSADPDQMLHSAATDLGLHCLQRPVYPNT